MLSGNKLFFIYNLFKGLVASLMLNQGRILLLGVLAWQPVWRCLGIKGSVESFAAVFSILNSLGKKY